MFMTPHTDGEVDGATADNAHQYPIRAHTRVPGPANQAVVGCGRGYIRSPPSTGW